MNKGTENGDTEAGEPVWEGGRNLAGTKLWEGKSEQHGLMGCLFQTKTEPGEREKRVPRNCRFHRSVQICKVLACKNHPWLVNRTFVGLEAKWFLKECFRKDSSGGVLKLRARKSKKVSDDRRGLWQKWMQKFLPPAFPLLSSPQVFVSTPVSLYHQKDFRTPG